MTQCRRCEECKDYSHHWMDNGKYGDEEYWDDNDSSTTHVCKHCGALGDECETCFGVGVNPDSEDDDDGSMCLECNGEGVIYVMEGSGDAD